MRKALDIFLTLNLIVIIGYLSYLWYIGDLRITLNEPAEAPARINQDAYTVFADTLQAEVNRSLGQPIEGYEPGMLMEVFPGLVVSDFDGVEASIGYYGIKNGQLEHTIPNNTLIHSAAGAISRQGFNTLLENVAARLNIDLRGEGTITEIMNAIST